MKLFILGLLLFFLSGCRVLDESIPIECVSRGKINLSYRNESSPVMLRIIQLKSLRWIDKNFYKKILKDRKPVDIDLIRENQLLVRPGKKVIIPINLSIETQYLLILAEYRDSSGDNWHQILDVRNRFIKKIKIELSGNKLYVKSLS